MIGLERARAAEFAPAPACQVGGFRHVFGPNLLRERAVRMVREGLVENQPAGVHPAMHLVEIVATLADLQINYIRDGEGGDVGQLNFERLPRFGDGLRLIRRGTPIDGELARRQDADVRVRIVCGSQFTKIIQKSPEGIGDVDHQRKNVKALVFGRTPTGPVRFRTHAFPMVTIVGESATHRILAVASAVTLSLMSVDNNPLLEPRFRIPFDRIQAAQVEPAAAELLKRARGGLEEVAAGKGPRTYANTLGELDVLTEPLDYAMGVVRHLESVATYPELRAAFNAVQPEVSAFYSTIPLNDRLWNGLKAFAATEEGATLPPARLRFLTKTMDSFRRHGAELDPEGKKKLEELDVELATVTTKFAENVLDSTNAFELIVTDKAKLAGLPPSALEAAHESAKRKQKEGWRFTLQAPDYTAVMTYLDDASIRQQIYETYNLRATEPAHDNRPLMARILELRREKARLLGFGNFADLVLEDRMALQRRQGARVPGGFEGQDGSGGSTKKTRSCWPSAGRSKARARRNSSRGMWVTTRRSNARRSMHSMKKRCARTFNWSTWWPGCGPW